MTSQPARRLRAVLAVRRAVALIRVSDVGDRGDRLISPELQRTSIESYTEPRGIRVVRWVEALDESASRERSPWWEKLDDAVGLIEAGEIDVVLVWKFSRAARHRRRWAVALDRIERAGGSLESSSEQLDPSTSSGRLTRGMLAELAAWESDVKSEQWRDIHARRVRAGRPANGKARWGYTYDSTSQLHRPDPDTGGVLAELYERYVAGESMYSMVKWLNDHGHRTAPGYSRAGVGPWSDRTLRRMLDSGFGAGLLYVAGRHVPGEHEPVIDHATWTAYQGARRARRVTRSSERSVYLLSGLLRCALVLAGGTRCGAAMTGGQFGHARTPKFRCQAGKEQRRHDGGYVTMRVVEDDVLAWLKEIRADAAASTEAALLRQARAERRRRDADTIGREITALDRQLTKLTLGWSGGTVPDDAYAASRDEIATRRQALVDQQLAARVDAGRRRPPREVVDELLDRWDELSVEMRRGALRELIDHIDVVPGRPRSAITIIPRWAP